MEECLKHKGGVVMLSKKYLILCEYIFFWFVLAESDYKLVGRGRSIFCEGESHSLYEICIWYSIPFGDTFCCFFNLTISYSIPTALLTSLLHILHTLDSTSLSIYIFYLSVIYLSLRITRYYCRVWKYITIALFLSYFRPFTNGSLHMNITGRSTLVLLCYFYYFYSAF
jgi:hypothetical protein